MDINWKSPWIWGGGLALGGLLLLGRNSGGGGNNTQAMLASQQIASQQDTALGLANTQLQGQVAAMRAAVQAEHEQTARLQTTAVAEVIQASIMADSANRAQRSQLEGATRLAWFDTERAKLAFAAQTDPRLVKAQAQVENHRIDVQANTAITQAKIQSDLSQFAIRHKGKDMGGIGGLIDGVVGAIASIF